MRRKASYLVACGAAVGFLWTVCAHDAATACVPWGGPRDSTWVWVDSLCTYVSTEKLAIVFSTVLSEATADSFARGYRLIPLGSTVFLDHYTLLVAVVNRELVPRDTTAAHIAARIEREHPGFVDHAFADFLVKMAR